MCAVTWPGSAITQPPLLISTLKKKNSLELVIPNTLGNSRNLPKNCHIKKRQSVLNTLASMMHIRTSHCFRIQYAKHPNATPLASVTMPPPQASVPTFNTNYPAFQIEPFGSRGMVEAKTELRRGRWGEGGMPRNGGL